MPFPDDPLDVTIRLAFGADRTADPGTWSWTDVTDRWHVPHPLTVRPGGSRREGAQQGEAGEIQLTFKNNDGHLTPLDARSPWWPHVDQGLPIQVTLDFGVGDPLTFGGFVQKIKPTWPGGGARHALVEIVASGVLREDVRGHAPPRSAPYRHYVRVDPPPLAYWPLNSGELTELGRPEIGTGLWRPFSGLTKYGVANLAPWLETGVTISEIQGTMIGDVPGSPDVAAYVGVDHIRRADLGGSGPSVLHLPGVGQNAGTEWIVTFTPSPSPLVEVQLNSGGSFVSIDDAPADLFFTSDAHHVRFEALQSGDDVGWTLHVDGVELISGVADDETLTGVGQVRLSYNPGTGRIPLTFGHVVVWSGDPPADAAAMLAATVTAVHGHVGESTTDRFARLCTEEGIPWTVIG